MSGNGELQDVEWGNCESFGVDDGELDGLSPQQCFVLGVEWQQIVMLADSGAGFEKPIHTSNMQRLGALLEQRCRSYHFFAYCEYDDWRWLKVMPINLPGEDNGISS